MKKILWIIVLVLILTSSAVAEVPKQQQEDPIYWVTADTLILNGENEWNARLTQPQATTPIILPFTEKLKNQLESLIVQFDSLASSASSKTKQLTIDEIEISVTLTAEGHIAIVSGKTEGSIKIKLRPKNK